MDIKEFQSHFYHDPKKICLNNAGMSLIPDVNRDVVKHWIERFYRESAHCSLEAVAQTEVTRERLAKFMGADVNEVAFFMTTASALSQAAFGIKFEKGDEILTWEQEYPSNFYPWRVAAERSGAKVIQIESDNWQTPTQKILERVNSRTRAIAVSWVQYQTGSVTDLKMLSEKLKGSNVWLVADIIQGAGVRPFHFHESGFDIACGGSHKWLCSAFGAAYMLVKNSRMAELTPIEVGAGTYGDFTTPKTMTNPQKTTAAKFEAGSKPFIELLGLGASLDLFAKCGVDAIFKEACRVADYFRTGLKMNNATVLSLEGPIVTFLPPAQIKIDEIYKRLDALNVSYARRASGVRVSFHAYNRESEADRVLEILS